jgi:hypothetical protein
VNSDVRTFLYEDSDRPGAKFEEIAPEAWRLGVDLALELIGVSDADCMSLDSDARDGGPQDNAVWRFLCKAREADDAQVERAFCAVLSDYIASARDGTVPDVEFLEKLVRRPVAQAVQPN